MKHFTDNAVLVYFSSAFVVLFLASDWDTTGKGSLSKDGWFPYSGREQSAITHLRNLKVKSLEVQWFLYYFFLALIYNKETIAVDHWGESKRHFFCMALNLRSVLLICWIYSIRSSQKFAAVTATLQVAKQCPATLALNWCLKLYTTSSTNLLC